MGRWGSTKISLPPVCDNAVRSSLFGSLGILKRHSLQHSYSYVDHQAISTQSTAVLSQNRSLNPTFRLLGPIHTGWTALQLSHTGPWHTLSVWLSLYLNYISSSVLSCFLSVQGNLPFSEGACLILEISSLLLHLPHEVLSCFFLSSFSLLSSFLHRYIWNPHGTFWWPGLLLVFIWCCGRTIVHVEVLFVVHSLRDLHFTSAYNSAFLELLSFSWQSLLFLFPWQ